MFFTNISLGFERNTTQQAIVSLVERITQSLDTDDSVIGVFIDLKKAFDTVLHDIFLKKMYACFLATEMLFN